MDMAQLQIVTLLHGKLQHISATTKLQEYSATPHSMEVQHSKLEDKYSEWQPPTEAYMEQ